MTHRLSGGVILFVVDAVHGDIPSDQIVRRELVQLRWLETEEIRYVFLQLFSVSRSSGKKSPITAPQRWISTISISSTDDGGMFASCAISTHHL